MSAHRCIAPDPFSPGRCPEHTDHESGLCGGHRAQAVATGVMETSITVPDPDLPGAPILREMRWVATEARALMFAHHDPERLERFEQRKRALLDALGQW